MLGDLLGDLVRTESLPRASCFEGVKAPLGDLPLRRAAGFRGGAPCDAGGVSQIGEHARGDRVWCVLLRSTWA